MLDVRDGFVVKFGVAVADRLRVRAFDDRPAGGSEVAAFEIENERSGSGRGRVGGRGENGRRRH